MVNEYTEDEIKSIQAVNTIDNFLASFNHLFKKLKYDSFNEKTGKFRNFDEFDGGILIACLENMKGELESIENTFKDGNPLI